MTATALLRARQYVPTAPEFRFDEAGHRYFWGDKEMSGVTSVLSKTLAKPALIQWAANQAVSFAIEHADARERPDGKTLYRIGSAALEQARTAHCRIRDEAGEFGKERHAEIAAYVNQCIEFTNGKPVLPVRLHARHLHAFRAWAAANDVTFLQSEAVFYDVALFVAGTADLVFLDAQGSRAIADVKIKRRIYGRDAFLQIAAYHLLSESMGNPPGEKSLVLRIDPKTAQLELKWSYNTEADKEAFKAVLQVYRYLQL